MTPVIADEVARFRTLIDGQLRGLFAPELTALGHEEAEELAVLVEVTVSFAAWDLMTRVAGHSTMQVSSAWTRAPLALLVPGSRLSAPAGSARLPGRHAVGAARRPDRDVGPWAAPRRRFMVRAGVGQGGSGHDL
ncbi:MAG TPA: hypothetical protein VMU75_11885 [Acidimicrobiales bacterium]|nr:hypothetical protein [Acidimicrobiales bacterium]